MVDMLTWPEKDADEVLDYSIDWTERLSGDTITSSDWEVTVSSPALVILNSPAPSFENTSTTLWLSGGVNNTYYTLTNTIETAGGRTMQQSVLLRVLEK